jgi:hypothetical protein
MQSLKIDGRKGDYYRPDNVHELVRIVRPLTMRPILSPLITRLEDASKDKLNGRCSNLKISHAGRLVCSKESMYDMRCSKVLHISLFDTTARPIGMIAARSDVVSIGEDIGYEYEIDFFAHPDNLVFVRMSRFFELICIAADYKENGEYPIARINTGDPDEAAQQLSDLALDLYTDPRSGEIVVPEISLALERKIVAVGYALPRV